MTEAFWPIMLKAILRSNEAVGLKGGIMHRIAKPSAVVNTTAGYRGILVQSCLSKVLHRATRHMAVHHWNRHILPLQIGGRKGCPAAFGHFCSRAFLSMMKEQGLSAAILFVDIAAAYYGVVREAILGPCASGRPLSDLVACLGLSPEDLQQLTYFVEQEPVLREQGAEELFTEVANELHRNTWFILSGDTKVIETHRGTRPGGSLADIVFSILFSKVLQRRTTSVLGPCIPRVPWSGTKSPWAPPPAASSCMVETSDVVYADDLASFLVSSTAAALPKVISGVAADTVDTLLPHGLVANVGPTKTAAIAAPVGRGSRATRRQLFSDGKGLLNVLPETKGGFRLDLVSVYKHLGSMVTHDGCLLPEIKHRLAAGRSALKEGKQRVFACKAIPLARRATLFRAHVLAAITPGMGTWPLLNQQEWRTLSGGIVSMYRQLLCLRTEGGFHCSEAQILSRVGLPAPDNLLQSERLRFVGQMVRHGPDAAWALLGHYTGYKDALRQAAAWLLAAVGSTCVLGDVVSAWPAWEAMMRDSPGQWKARIRRAEAWYALKVEQLAALEGFARDMWPAKLVHSPTPLESCSHACLACRIAFSTRQQWGAHAHRVHGYHSRAHAVARGRECQACGLRVATAAKLRIHLRLSLACVQHLERLEQEGMLRADLTQGHALEPAVPGIGKAALGPAEPEVLPALAAALDSFQAPQQDIDEAILSLVQGFIAPLPVLRRTCSEWAGRLQEGALRDACEDVLLVMHPQHLCDRISGRNAPAVELCAPFSPRVDCPVRCSIASSLPILVAGPEPPAAFTRAFEMSCPLVRISLSAVEQWRSDQVAGACVTFPLPPPGTLPAFRPSPCPLKSFRSLRQWTDLFLRSLRALIALARFGRRVLARIPGEPRDFQPLATWLSAMTQARLLDIQPARKKERRKPVLTKPKEIKSLAVEMFHDALDRKSVMDSINNKDVLDPEKLYSKTGCCQAAQGGAGRGWYSLPKVLLSTFWIAIDTDYNQGQGDGVFVLMDNLICAYFCFEISIRWLAYQVPRDALSDNSFLFDLFLAVSMAIETWGWMLVAAGVGIHKHQSSPGITPSLRALRLIRITRAFRMSRIFRFVPELMILLHGMFQAIRSVLTTLLLLVLVTYTFAVAMTQLLQNKSIGGGRFDSVPQATTFLLLQTLCGFDYHFMMDMMNADALSFAFMLAYQLVGSLTLMNMLIGVMVDVVGNTAQIEQEEQSLKTLKRDIADVVKLTDENEDQTVTSVEFNHMYEGGVNVLALVDYADFVFRDTPTLTLEDFVETVLQFRGSSQATVKDVVDLRVYVSKELARLAAETTVPAAV
ncbi:unnamed protein product [Symbiodinium sp. KB8]|nr:unnamed protein product [Symbiodinium sp. KB8]